MNKKYISKIRQFFDTFKHTLKIIKNVSFIFAQHIHLLGTFQQEIAGAVLTIRNHDRQWKQDIN